MRSSCVCGRILVLTPWLAVAYRLGISSSAQVSSGGCRDRFSEWFMDLSASVGSVVAQELASFMRELRKEHAQSRRADREYYDQHFAKINRRIDSVEFRLASAGSSISSSNFVSPNLSQHSSPKTPTLCGVSRDIQSNFDTLDVLNRKHYLEDLALSDVPDEKADFLGLHRNALWPSHDPHSHDDAGEEQQVQQVQPPPLNTPCFSPIVPNPVHDPKVCALCRFAFTDKKCVNSNWLDIPHVTYWQALQEAYAGMFPVNALLLHMRICCS
jgi:hypothetical protein